MGEEPIEFEDFVIHFSAIDKFAQILLNQGIDSRKESIRIEKIEVAKSNVCKLISNKIFKGFFEGAVVDKDNEVYPLMMKLESITFDVTGCERMEYENKTEIYMSILNIYKNSKCEAIEVTGKEKKNN